MKKQFSFSKISILGAIAWIFFTTVVFAQNTFVYYENRKVVLEPVREKILVKFAPGATFQEQKILLSAVFLKPVSVPIARGRKDFISVETNEGATLEQLQGFIKQLQENEKVLSASFYYKSGNYPGLVTQTDEVLVQLKSANDLNLLEKESKLLYFSYEIPEYFNPDLYLVKLSKKSPGNSIDIANYLHEGGKFVFAEPNLCVDIRPTTNDPLYNKQWSLENRGSNPGPNGHSSNFTLDVDIDAELAWGPTFNRTGTNVTIAIIDDGVERQHPDLGYSANSSLNRMLPGYDAFGTRTDGSNASTSDSHGTRCAGLAAATANNSIGVAGVAPGARIMPIRLYESNSSPTVAMIVKAFNYALCNGADVISTSWGLFSEPTSTSAADAINRAIDLGRLGKGAVVLASSGNENTTIIRWPATMPKVIAVGAATPCEDRWSNSVGCYFAYYGAGSNYGPNLDIVAPGVDMPTTNISVPGQPLYIEYFGATSAATPIAAGIAALIISVESCFKGSEVRDILEQTCNKVTNYGTYSYATTGGHPNGTWNNEMGYGLVNANDAVTAALNRPKPTCPIEQYWVGCANSSRIGQSISDNIKLSIVSFPNPFQQIITFKYELQEITLVSLVVKDSFGRKIATLHDMIEQKAGTHETTFTNNNLPSGMYFYTFTAGTESRTFKLLKTE